MEAQSHEAGAGIAPLCFALGVAVLLVGLIVNPLVFVPNSLSDEVDGCVGIEAARPPAQGLDASQKTLAASKGTWSGSPTSYAFQWQTCDPSGSPCNDITGATSSTYVVRKTDVGFTLRVHVTARNAFGFSFAASPATDVVS